jgi:hypothetical protein
MRYDFWAYFNDSIVLLMTTVAADILSALEGCGHLRFTESLSQLYSQPTQFDRRCIEALLPSYVWFFIIDTGLYIGNLVV